MLYLVCSSNNGNKGRPLFDSNIVINVFGHLESKYARKVGSRCQKTSFHVQDIIPISIKFYILTHEALDHKSVKVVCQSMLLTKANKAKILG